MKYLTLLLLLSVSFVFDAFGQALSAEDRSKVLDHLRQSKKELLKIVRDLSEEQLNYKPNADTWSVAECLEHVAISEKNLAGVVQMALQQKPDPSQRAQLALSDEALLTMITDRSNKVKTRPDAEPHQSFGSFEGTAQAFEDARKANIAFVKGTQEDLRNRYFDFPFGKVDVVQVLLFISAHSRRHAAQMKEVIALQSFPG